MVGIMRLNSTHMPHVLHSHKAMQTLNHIPPFAQGLAVCPNLPFGLCPRLFDEAHMPEADEDDAALYGTDSAGSNPAASWLLVLAGIIGLVALVPSTSSRASAAAVQRSRTGGCVFVLGLIVGMYLSLQLFPGQRLLQVRSHCMCAHAAMQ